MPDAVPTIVERATEVRDLLDATIAQASSSSSSPGSPDDRLRGLLVGLERVKNAADGVQSLVMTELGREALAVDALERGDADRPIKSHEEFVPDEIAVLLSCTRMAASTRYGLAWQAARYEQLAATWQAGAIDGRKVGVIADHVQHVAPEIAESLVSEAVVHATRRTAPQTREWLRRRVLSIDPEVAEKRREAAVLERKVVITPSADGMSELWAQLPSVAARRMQVALSQLAQGLGSDDPRTMDQRRADVLIDLVLGRTTPVAVDVQLVVPVGAASGRSAEPAWIPGLGAITAQAARDLLQLDGGDPQQRVSSMLLVDAASGALVHRVEPRYRPSLALDKAVRSRDITCRFPGCRRSALGRASGTDLDHTVPWPEGPTTDSNLAVLCRHHHRLKHSAGWKVTSQGDGTMMWTTPTGRTVVTEPWQYVSSADDQSGRHGDHEPDDSRDRDLDRDRDPPEE